MINLFEKYDIFFKFNKYELLTIKHYIRSLTPEKNHEEIIINLAIQIDKAIELLENAK